MYISHMRSEGDDILPSVDELITIARRAHAPAEIYHLKAAGRENWGRLGEVIARIEAARAQGLRITADMYTYTAGATGLDAAMPLWVQAGGLEAWIARLRDPAIRARVAAEMRRPGAHLGESLLRRRTGRDDARRFRNPALRRYPAAPSPTSPASAANRPRRPRWTWSSRTAAGSARSIS